MGVSAKMCVCIHAEHSQPPLCNCSWHLLKDSVSGFQPPGHREREREDSLLRTVYRLHVHLTYLWNQERKKQLLQTLPLTSCSLLSTCRLTWTIFVHLFIPHSHFSWMGGICKFLSNSFLHSDVLQLISFPFFSPIHRPHTLMQCFTLPA